LQVPASFRFLFVEQGGLTIATLSVLHQRLLSLSTFAMMGSQVKYFVLVPSIM